MRVWLIAIVSLLIQGLFSLIGFLVGLAVVGLYLGYTRAWAICAPPVVQPHFVDEDD